MADTVDSATEIALGVEVAVGVLCWAGRRPAQHNTPQPPRLVFLRIHEGADLAHTSLNIPF